MVFSSTHLGKMRFKERSFDLRRAKKKEVGQVRERYSPYYGLWDDNLDKHPRLEPD